MSAIHEKVKNGPQIESIFGAATNAARELDVFGVQTITGNSLKRKIRTAGASPSNNRTLYNGVDASKGTYDYEVVSTGISSTAINIDKADLSSVGDATAQADYMASELEGGAIEWRLGLGHDVFYATLADDGWDGLQAKVDADSLKKLASSASTDIHSSIYLVYTGKNGTPAYQKGARIIFGGGGEISNPEWDTDGFTDSEGRKVPGVSTLIEAYPCVSRGDKKAVLRYANIGTAAGKTATDEICAELIDLLPGEIKADLANCYFMMSARSVSQIRASRQATNQTGAPAPYPTEAFNVKIIETSSISDTEPKVS
ncbi:hypothetical protein AAEX28_04205 [Lentisphaerota bacterium WC36G]|nr:hypothetical protein LJT99_07075 [Lentisphaerae bacterium WC36]